jgi:serine/threonine-protein kinase
MVAEPGPGDVIDDRFELIEVIGEGGMGVVWEARDLSRDGVVALKILGASVDPGADRFHREAEALSKIDHPAVVRAIAHGETERFRYIVMDRLHGVTLAEKLATGPMAVGDVVELGRGVVAGLVALHEEGLAHRDIKPSNVFLVDGEPSQPRLLDFGLIKGSGGLPVTATGVLLGTPGYMSPEQVRGEKTVGPRGDVFAFACVLFECLAGNPAFAGDSTEALLTRILLEEPSLHALRGKAPDALIDLLGRMLRKAPQERPDAAEVARELADVQVAATEGSLPGGLKHGAILAGRYRVDGWLGQGGMGVVLLGRHLELGTKVAIKLLRANQPGVDEARFLREARAAARIDSEHVVRVLDVGRLDDGAPFMVMEHLNGSDLSHALETAGRFAVEEAVSIVLQACEAIGAAHALGVIHRDIKPSNIYLSTTRGGGRCVKVLDFGISKLVQPLEGATGEGLGMTGTSAVIGSAWYMSPEQLQDSKRVDARTDIWSLGVVLYEVLTGSRPFEGQNAAAVGARIATAPPPSLRGLRPDVSSGLEAVVLRCLEKEPDARYSDVAALSKALSGALDRKAAVGPRRAYGAISVIAVLAIVVGLVWLRGAADPPAPEVPSPAMAVSADVGSEAGPEAGPEARSEVVPEAQSPAASSPPPPTVKPVGRPKPSATAAPADSKRIDLMDPALRGR